MAKRKPKTELAWDTEAGIHLRLLWARAALRTHKLWGKFPGDTREYDAFSIHDLARAAEEELAKVGVTYSFSVEKWASAGNGRLIEGWAIFTCADQDGEEYRVYTVGEGLDSSDKGFGKAISYARKNGLIQGLNLAIGVDNETSREQPNEQARQAPPANGGPAHVYVPDPDASLAVPQGFTFVFNGQPYLLAPQDVAQRVLGYINQLANIRAVEDWRDANAGELANFFRYSKDQGYVLKLAVQRRIKDLQDAIDLARGQGVQ